MTWVGRHMGRYRILEQLGQGGMSIVYRGLDTALDREVAVKVLHPHLASKDESRKRLAREAKAVAKLHHPNILEVFDFAGADAQDAYIVTEYIRGQTLRQFINEQTFDPPEVAAMVVHQVACALAHAHEAGIIHRDLKPENVMVRHDGVIKLMDFGIAKIIDRDDRMTMTGALVGSPAHMAPEIIEGEAVGPEADIFSLGTMLYFFATTRLPFVGPTTTSTLKRILDGTYDDPRQLAPTLSDELSEILATCLARQPAARYPYAGKLRDALFDYLTGVGLEDVQGELASFFADPPSYRKEVRERVAAALVKRGEQLISEGRGAKALSCLNQVLALSPAHPRALEQLQNMNVARKRQQARKQWARASVSALVVAGLAFCAFRAYAYLTHVPDYVPVGNRLGDPPLRAELFPPAPAAPMEAKEPPPLQSPIAAAPPRTPKVETAPATAKVTFDLRPYGWLRVDGGKKTPEDKLHQLQLTPGKHALTFGCNFCLDRQQEVEIKDGQPNYFPLLVQAKPGRVAFDVDPKVGTLRVQLSVSKTETRAVSELKPFTVDFEPGETNRTVTYELTAPGFKPVNGKVELKPASALPLRLQLEKE